MKFPKLIKKFERKIDKLERGKQVDPEKLQKLTQLLTEKKTRYEEKIRLSDDPGKKKKLETKLKVVNAQIAKAIQLQSNE